MGNFYTDVICKDPRFHSTAQCRDIALLEPVTRAAVQSIIADAAAMGITLRVSETYRSQELQTKDYEEGASQLKTVGVHHYGLACDFFKVVNGKASWAGDWTFLSRLARKHGMISGLDWGHEYVPDGFHDPDHVQRIAVADQSKLFSGEWYPDATYTPIPAETVVS